ncbi:MAG: hypothetical protein KDC84_14680 [Crocinitomicaceae bacterium]|nr:hypothetical protein [Crocinitomicaceae bacterium]
MKKLLEFIDKLIVKEGRVAIIGYDKKSIRDNKVAIFVFAMIPIAILLLATYETDWKRIDYKLSLIMSPMIIFPLFFRRAIILRLKQEADREKYLVESDTTTAVITSQYKGKYHYIFYEYIIDGKKYRTNYLESIPDSCQDNFVDMEIEIKYSKDNPIVSEPTSKYWEI